MKLIEVRNELGALSTLRGGNRRIIETVAKGAADMVIRKGDELVAAIDAGELYLTTHPEAAEAVVALAIATVDTLIYATVAYAPAVAKFQAAFGHLIPQV